jgi:hypothetical protein
MHMATITTEETIVLICVAQVAIRMGANGFHPLTEAHQAQPMTTCDEVLSGRGKSAASSAIASISAGTFHLLYVLVRQ